MSMTGGGLRDVLEYRLVDILGYRGAPAGDRRRHIGISSATVGRLISTCGF